jgi:hypothetical protein
MELSPNFTRHLARLLPQHFPKYRDKVVAQGRPRVLVAGIYVGNKANTVEHLVEKIAASQHVDVEQRWMAMAAGTPPSSAVSDVTLRTLEGYIPKWTALAELIGDRPWEQFDYVVFCDDDIWVGDGFLDHLIGYQQKYDLAVAQPSRTWRSFTDWAIVRRRLTLKIRETNFVESGPVVSMDKRFLPLALPFSEESPMGWGYDLIWPVLAQQHDLKVGIIDAIPVCHSLRGRGVLYSAQKETDRMAEFLSTRDHIREKITLQMHR